MDLGNFLEVEVQHLLIEWMVGLGHQDGVPMVSALMCTIINWIEPMMSHDIRLLGSHDLTNLLHCIVSQS